MPIFEYICPECENTQETLVLSDVDTHEEKCKICGRRMEKQISLSSFHLKGTGWYATDYANKSKNKNKDKSKKEKTK